MLLFFISFFLIVPFRLLLERHPLKEKEKEEEEKEKEEEEKEKKKKNSESSPSEAHRVNKLPTALFYSITTVVSCRFHNSTMESEASEAKHSLQHSIHGKRELEKTCLQ
jgi:CO dehydrogenase/acetyl-CoA synthase beta subunit